MDSTLLIVERPGIFRDCLRTALDAAEGFAVAGAASSTAEAIEMTNEICPDLVVTEMSAPGIDGARLAAAIHSPDAPPRVTVLSSDGEQPSVTAALRAGVSAYVLKESRLDAMLTALAETRADRRYVDRTIAARWAARVASGEEKRIASRALTDREREVLRHVALGLPTKEVAVKLCVSPRTVDTHRRSLMRKLGVRNAASLVSYAYRNGLMSA